MATLNIKSQRVYELAKALSQRTGQTMTSVIEVALERELATLERGRGDLRTRKMAELDALVALTAPRMADLPSDAFADLYDEQSGLLA